MLVLESLTPFAIVGLLALLAARFGHDSRDTIEDRPEPSLGSPR